MQRIAEAENPKAELERLRGQNKTRQARHREKNASAPLHNGGTTVGVTAKLEEDRESLIEWAQSAPLDRVANALSYIRHLDAATAVSDSNQPAEPGAA